MSLLLPEPTTPAPAPLEKIEDYLWRYSLRDCCHEADGAWVPLGVAMIAAQRVAAGTLELNKPSWIK